MNIINNFIKSVKEITNEIELLDKLDSDNEEEADQKDRIHKLLSTIFQTTSENVKDLHDKLFCLYNLIDFFF